MGDAGGKKNLADDQGHRRAAWIQAEMAGERPRHHQGFYRSEGSRKSRERDDLRVPFLGHLAPRGLQQLWGFTAALGQRPCPPSSPRLLVLDQGSNRQGLHPYFGGDRLGLLGRGEWK